MESTLISQILAVLTEVGNWFVSAVTNALSLFVDTNGDMTVIGIVSFVSLGIGLICLVIGLITNFFKLRS